MEDSVGNDAGGIHAVIPPAAPQRWWREWQLAVLILFVLATYFSRITTLTVRGEESRRATVAMEMLETGEWIVPRLQGDPFFMSSRPPLQNWTIAVIGYLRGGVDVLAVRLPSTTAVLLIVVLIYGYSRTLLSRTGALAAGAAYATMGQVLVMGRLGETDLLFSLFVSSSLLLWHTGYCRKWPAAHTWMLAYMFAALATLTKGPQAPVYFAAPIGMYLFWTRNWRYGLSWAHAAGILVFVAIWGSWQLPFFLEVGVEGVRHIYFGDVRMYGHERTLSAMVKHMVEYPTEILFGCLMPWSILLLVYFRRDLRQRIGRAGDNVRFLACCLVATFPTVWFVTQAQTRFYMSLYPCIAVLVGLAVQRCIEAEPQHVLRRIWSRYVTVMAVIMLLAGVGIMGATLLDKESILVARPLWFAVVFLLATAVLSWTAIRTRQAKTAFEGAASILTIAAFMGLTCTGAYVNILRRSSVEKVIPMTQIKQKLPENVRLYSIDDVDHGFAFYYAKPIFRCPWPEPNTQLPPDVEYFCFRLDDSRAAELLPLAWETVGVFSAARNRGDHELETLVVVAHRLEDGPTHNAEQIVREYQIATSFGDRIIR